MVLSSLSIAHGDKHSSPWVASRATVIVDEILMMQKQLPWGKGLEALQRTVTGRLERTEAFDYVSSKTLPPLSLPVQQVFKLKNNSLGTGGFITYFSPSEQLLQRQLFETIPARLDKALKVKGAKSTDLPEMQGYSWSTAKFLVGVALFRLDDPGVERGRVAPLVIGIEILHRQFEPSVAEFEARMRAGTLQTGRAKAVTPEGLLQQDPMVIFNQIPFGSRAEQARKALIHYDISVDNDASIAAAGFSYLGESAAVELVYVGGVIGRKFIHIMYELSGSSARAMLEKAVAALTKEYGRPYSRKQTTVVWLVDPLFVTASVVEHRGLVTIGFVHFTFDPEAARIAGHRR